MSLEKLLCPKSTTDFISGERDDFYSPLTSKYCEEKNCEYIKRCKIYKELLDVPQKNLDDYIVTSKV